MEDSEYAVAEGADQLEHVARWVRSENTHLRWVLLKLLIDEQRVGGGMSDGLAGYAVFKAEGRMSNAT